MDRNGVMGFAIALQAVYVDLRNYKRNLYHHQSNQTKENCRKEENEGNKKAKECLLSFRKKLHIEHVHVQQAIEDVPFCNIDIL